MFRRLMTYSRVSFCLSQDLYPNFARTPANHAENVIALVRLIRHLNWTRVGRVPHYPRQANVIMKCR
jgi:hypothetical protein